MAGRYDDLTDGDLKLLIDGLVRVHQSMAVGLHTMGCSVEDFQESVADLEFALETLAYNEAREKSKKVS